MQALSQTRVKTASNAARCVVPRHYTHRRAFTNIIHAAAKSVPSDALNSDQAVPVLRRWLLFTGLLPVVANVPGSGALETAYKKFLGYSQAPDLYMGYGQAKDAAPMYTFEYPADWDEDVPTKTEKSTMGMDGRVSHPRTRKEMAYVIALGGKDYRDSVLKDAKTSLIVVAGGDPDMRQALSDGVVHQAQRRINGTDMYVYDVRSDTRRYLSTIGKKGDTVYALVVTAPASTYERDAAGLRHIQDTFQLL